MAKRGLQAQRSVKDPLRPKELPRRSQGGLKGPKEAPVLGQKRAKKPPEGPGLAIIRGPLRLGLGARGVPPPSD